MIYTFSDTIPANTTRSNRRRTVMKMTKGIIHKLEIQFPIGCAGVAHCTINAALHQVWPTNANESFASDGFVMSFDESYEIAQRPYSLDLWTWNLSTAHEHTITVRIGILPKKSMLTYIVQTAVGLFLKKGVK